MSSYKIRVAGIYNKQTKTLSNSSAAQTPAIERRRPLKSAWAAYASKYLYFYPATQY